jgi:hypothetical protein
MSFTKVAHGSRTIGDYAYRGSDGVSSRYGTGHCGSMIFLALEVGKTSYYPYYTNEYCGIAVLSG